MSWLLRLLAPLVRATACGLVVLAVVFNAPALAQFSVPSDGSDGVLNPAGNVEIDLGLATTGSWDTPGNGNGVYDPEQWIVVFKYSSVNIAAGRTVTFKNHPSNPPVVWLVQGDVVINGQVIADGSWNVSAIGWNPGGPGGFRGGRLNGGAWTGAYGPGANNLENVAPQLIAGNPSCFPLIGGPGFCRGRTSLGADTYYAGGGGGGAILLASSTRISGSGRVSASSWGNYGGAGGMVRLVAPSVDLWQVQAKGTVNGRIRVEADEATIPNSTPAYSHASLPESLLFLRHGQTPAIRVVSVSGVAAPVDPRARFTIPADFVVPSPAVEVVLECRNVPPGSAVQVYLRSAENTNLQTVNAQFVSGDDSLSIWIASGNLGTGSVGFATVQARAALP